MRQPAGHDADPRLPPTGWTVRRGAVDSALAARPVEPAGPEARPARRTAVPRREVADSRPDQCASRGTILRRDHRLRRHFRLSVTNAANVRRILEGSATPCNALGGGRVVLFARTRGSVPRTTERIQGGFSQMQRHRYFTRFVVTAGLVASVAGVAGLSAASANPVVSTLVATPSPASNIDVSVAPTSTTVNVALDNQCSNAFNVGQNYAITATSANTGVATVAPGVSGALNCSSVKGSATSATFTLTAVCNGTTTVNFLPVAGPKGLQDKVAGTSVNVTVTNTAAATCGGTTGGGGGTRPAAPAVTNAYLNANSVAASTCK